MSEVKKEFEASWYDERYKVDGYKQEYFKEPEKSVYYPIWNELFSLLKPEDKILEVGCGAGQLARMILYSKISQTYVKGFDFSKEAIRLCKQNTPHQHHEKFVVDSVYNEDVYDCDYNTVICCEVFEHLDTDVEVLMNIKKGTKILFTVPNFNSKSHVRYFKDRDTIRMRYESVVKFISIKEIPVSATNKIYLVNCVKK